MLAIILQSCLLDHSEIFIDYSFGLRDLPCFHEIFVSDSYHVPSRTCVEDMDNFEVQFWLLFKQLWQPK